MNNMLGYIFGSLHTSEKAISEITKCLRKQNRFNKLFTICSVVGTASVLVLVDKYDRQQQTIEKLTKEVEELKEMKGEW